MFVLDPKRKHPSKAPRGGREACLYSDGNQGRQRGVILPFF
jgi:hypothetical protein